MEEIVEQVVDGGAVGSRGLGATETIPTGVVAAVCLVGGAAIGAYVAKRYFQKKYEQLATEEIAEAKAYYAQLNKVEPYDTPGGALDALSERGKAAADAVLSYQGEKRAEQSDDSIVIAEEDQTIMRKNIFTEAATSEWDQDQEQSKRDAHPEDPYILSQDEYMENEPDYKQVPLTYYAEDDVLVDEKDQPIPDIDEVVGEDNLTRFGHGSRDNRMLYIRNDRIEMAFEIVKNEGSYTREVAGRIEHSDRPRVLKMRGERN